MCTVTRWRAKAAGTSALAIVEDVPQHLFQQVCAVDAAIGGLNLGELCFLALIELPSALQQRPPRVLEGLGLSRSSGLSNFGTANFINRVARETLDVKAVGNRSRGSDPRMTVITSRTADFARG